MWFALGFVTLMLSVGYQWWSRWHHKWQGESESMAGIACETQVRSFKGLVYGLMVALDAPETFRFELKRERLWDRFFKWTGLTVEHQFGHAGFDSLVYVASDDQHLFSRLAGNKDFLHAVQHCFAAEYEDRWLKKIVCANGRLWMVIGSSDWDRKGAQGRTREFAARLLPLLKRVSSALDACMPDSAPSTRDRYLIPTVVILALSSGLAINGALSWARSLMASHSFILDTQPLTFHAWLVAACIVGTLMLASVILLKGSSRVHLVLLELAMVGTFGAVTSSAIELRDANIDFDQSLPKQIEKRLIGKSINERKRLFRAKQTTYSLQYRGWTGDMSESSVSVSASTFEQAEIGDTLLFEQYAGYFGWPWAEFKGWKPAAVRISPST